MREHPAVDLAWKIGTLMKPAIPNDVVTKSYVILIDGEVRSAYGLFVEALKAGLEMKQKFPHSQVKVQDAEEA